MRRRRFTRCILQSEAAISSGALENARIALDEARTLIPDAPEIAVLDGRIVDRRDGSESSTKPAPSPLSLAFEGEDDDLPVSEGLVQPASDAVHLASAQTSSDRGRTFFLTGLPLAVVPLAMVGVLGFGLGQISELRSHQAEPAVPRSPDVLSGGDQKPRVLTSSMGIGLDALAPVGAVATSGASLLSQEHSRLRVPAPGTDVAAADDEQIRGALKRYEKAYNRFNDKVAGAAPVAERGADEAPFEALPSRRISLGACDISISGEVGVATCAGSALPDTKISGAGAAAQRYWAFDLRKNADGWRIEQLKVE